MRETILFAPDAFKSHVGVVQRLGCYSLRSVLMLSTYGLAQLEVCAAPELEEYPAAGLGLQNIDWPNGAVVREELRPIEQQVCRG